MQTFARNHLQNVKIPNVSFDCVFQIGILRLCLE